PCGVVGFQPAVRQITESEWIAWFSMAFEEEPRDLDTLKRRLEATIRFDTKILDADSRVGMMLDDLMKALERDNQEWVLKDEGKVVVHLMVKAKPAKPAKSHDGRGHALKRPDEMKPDGGAGSAKPPSADGVTKSDTPSAPARKPAACLKCKSTAHKVTDCPKTAPGEAQALLAAQMQKWKDAREARPTANVIDLGPNRSKVEGGATVADVGSW
ncbi:hypothetical protein DYB32_010152, partial [Aphanomyces invadans]